MIVVKREVPIVDVSPLRSEANESRTIGATLGIHRPPSPGYTSSTLSVRLSPVECRAVSEALIGFADEAERSV